MKSLLAALFATATLILPTMAPEAAQARAYADASHRAQRPTVAVVAQPARWDPHNKTWWHGRPGWRGYRGRLRGFWFVPGQGYYPAPRGDHQWRRGEYLPDAWRHNYVREWVWFGLKPAPRGYAWVWCGDQFALVSQGSGLILDIISDIY